MGNSCAGGSRRNGRSPRRRSPTALSSHAHFAELGIVWSRIDALVLLRAKTAAARLAEFHRGGGGGGGGVGGGGTTSSGGGDSTDSRWRPASSVLANPRAFLSAIESDLELVLALPLAIHSAAAPRIQAKGVVTGEWDVAVDRLGRQIDYIHSVTAGIVAGSLDRNSDVMALVELKVGEVVALLSAQLDALRETFLPVLLDDEDAAQRAAVHAKLRSLLREWNDLVDPHVLRTAPRDVLARHARYAARQPWYGDMVLAGVHVLSGREWDAVAPLLPRLAKVLPENVRAGQDDPIPLRPEDFDESSEVEEEQEEESD